MYEYSYRRGIGGANGIHYAPVVEGPTVFFSSKCLGDFLFYMCIWYLGRN